MTHPVAVGWIHPGEWSDAFGMSLLAMSLYEVGRTGRPPYYLNNRVASGGIVRGRNEIARDFLDRSGCEWLLFVDADMGFEPDSLERLLRSADPERRPVMGALCFGLRRTKSDHPELSAQSFQTFPTVYLWRERQHEAGFQVVTDYPRDTVVEVSATGAACVLIHRTVLETIRGQYGDIWFEPVVHPSGTEFSEDMSFYVRCAAVDVPVHVDTSVKTSHDKGGIFLTETTWLQQQTLAAADPRPDFVVTGTGRCGTGYMAQVLTDLGVPCGHEQVWTDQGVRPQPQLAGDASWMAIPDLDSYRGTVIHLVRNPLDVINSLVGIKFFSDPATHGDHHRFAAGMVDMSGDDLQDAMRWWLLVNLQAEQHADLTVPIEDPDWPLLLKTIGRQRDPDTIDKAVADVPRTVNHRPRARLKWRDLPAGPVKDELIVMAGRYGYKTPAREVA